MKTPSLAFDHAVLVVDDLEHAVRQFGSLGFTVVMGGVNGPTHNALIAFSDSTYIELIALRSATTRRVLGLADALGVLALRRSLKTDLNNRLLAWFQGPSGLRDVCFRVDDLAELQSTSAAAGLALTPAVRFQRDRPDGIKVQWRLVGAVDVRQPFFIEDETPLALRIPEGDARHHPNGATGIVQIRTRGALDASASNVEIVTDPALGEQLLGLTLSTDGSRKTELPPSRCCGAIIDLR